MKLRAYEWDPRPPTVRERVVCGIWLAGFVLATASYYVGWRVFGNHDNWASGGLFFGGLFLMARMPGVKRT